MILERFALTDASDEPELVVRVGQIVDCLPQPKLRISIDSVAIPPTNGLLTYLKMYHYFIPRLTYAQQVTTHTLS